MRVVGVGALLCLTTLLFSLSSGVPAIDAVVGCATSAYDETATVQYVFDGDTIELADKRRVRLLGINSPEVARKNKAGEPFGDEATDQLRRWLPKGTEIGLVYDVEKKDRYGRLLAHVFVDAKDSVNAKLLREGGAWTLVVPPNTQQVACYHQAENEAQVASRGLWRNANYQARDVRSINDNSEGFAIVKGRVQSTGESRDAIWVNYRGGFALRVAKSDLAYFSNLPIEQLVGKTVTARGWIYSSRRGPRMRIRHPSALEIGD